MARTQGFEIVTGRAWITLLVSAAVLFFGAVATVLSGAAATPEGVMVWAGPAVFGLLVGVVARRVLVADRSGLIVSWQPVGWRVVDVAPESIAFVSLDVEYRPTLSFRPAAMLLGGGLQPDVAPVAVVSMQLRDGRDIVLVRQVSRARAKRIVDAVRKSLHP